MSLQRARLRMAGLGLGLENEEAQPGEGGEVPVANPEAEETVEQEVMEVTEAEGEVKEQEEAVEQLEEAQAQMESIYISVQASLEDGGIDAKSAVYLNHAVNATLRSIGVSRANLPSLESFGGATGRLSATKVSLESIGDWLKKIWQAIKNAVLKTIDWVKNLFAKVFGGAEKLIKRAEELEKEADKMKSDKPSEKITFRSVSKLHTTGKADAGQFQAGLDSLNKVVGVAYTQIPKISEAMLTVYASKMGDIAKASNAEEINKIHAGVAAGTTASFKGLDLVVTATTTPMSGGYKVDIQRGDTNSPEKGQISLRQAQKFDQIKEDSEMEPLDSTAVKAMLKTVKDIATTIKENKKTVEDMEKARKDAVEDYEKAIKDLEKNKPNFVQQGFVSFMLRGIRRNYATFLGSLSSHAFASCRAALVLCEKSIAAYGTKEKK